MSGCVHTLQAARDTQPPYACAALDAEQARAPRNGMASYSAVRTNGGRRAAKLAVQRGLSKLLASACGKRLSSEQARMSGATPAAAAARARRRTPRT